MSQDAGIDTAAWVQQMHEYALSAADGGNFSGAITAWQQLLDQNVLEDASVSEVHWNIGLAMAAAANGDEAAEKAAVDYLGSHGWSQDYFEKAKASGAAPA